MRPKRPPKLQTTTLWYHPTQQHTDEPMGDPRYPGRTPTYVVWNLLERYTRAGDVVVDPFCGGGTTLDVARSMGRDRARLRRRAAPGRHRAGGRARPGRSRTRSADFFFLDPPYSTHVTYSGSGRVHRRARRLRAGLLRRAGRRLRRGGALPEATGATSPCTCSDTFKKKKRLRRDRLPSSGRSSARRFRPIDHVAVVRGNAQAGEARASTGTAAEDRASSCAASTTS